MRMAIVVVWLIVVVIVAVASRGGFPTHRIHLRRFQDYGSVLIDCVRFCYSQCVFTIHVATIWRLHGQFVDDLEGSHRLPIWCI